VPWRVLTPRTLDELKREALNPQYYNRQAKLLLFEYAVVHQSPTLLEALANLKFNAALLPAQHQASIEHKYYHPSGERSMRMAWISETRSIRRR
jgi:hypothetical protein